jgi:hypothetical protein
MVETKRFNVMKKPKITAIQVEAWLKLHPKKGLSLSSLSNFYEWAEKNPSKSLNSIVPTKIIMEDTVRLIRNVNAVLIKNNQYTMVIKEGTLHYKALQMLIPHLNMFCEKHNLNKKEGYLLFVKTSYEFYKTKKHLYFSKFGFWALNMMEQIEELFMVKEELKTMDNSTRKLANECLEYYRANLMSMVGSCNDYKKNPLDFIHFVRTAQLLKQKEWEARTFIDAQFKSLEWTNGVPPLYGLYDESGLARYLKGLKVMGMDRPKKKLLPDGILK